MFTLRVYFDSDAETHDRLEALADEMAAVPRVSAGLDLRTLIRDVDYSFASWARRATAARRLARDCRFKVQELPAPADESKRQKPSPRRVQTARADGTLF